MSLLDLVSTDAAIRREWEGSVLRAMIAKQVQDLRKNAGWTQERLAREIGTKPAAISRLENRNAKSFPSVRTLRKVSAAFDVALVIRFETLEGWLQWIVDYSGSRIVPFGQEGTTESRPGNPS